MKSKISHKGLDKQVVNLCEALNKIPEIVTTESCCGHGLGPYRIWMRASSLQALNLLLWSGCHRWWCWDQHWDLFLCTADPNRDGNDLQFILQHKEKGDSAYQVAEDLALKINKFIEEWVKR